MDEKSKKELQAIIDELFKMLGMEVSYTIEEIENAIKINLETDNTGLLIGYHGETLSSLQLIISLMFYKKTNQWAHLSLNIGNYREKREEQLSLLVQRITQEVKNTKEPQALPPLSSNERRIVHLLLQNNPDVLSESEGEGRNRRVFIKLKI